MSKAQANLVHVTLRLVPSGRITKLEAFFSDRLIIEVKALVEINTGIHVKDQRLLVGGRSLDDDDRTLADYGFSKGHIEVAVLDRPRQSFITPITVTLPQALGGESIEVSVKPHQDEATVRARLSEIGIPVDERDYFLAFAGTELSPGVDLKTQGVSRHATLRFQPRMIKVRAVALPFFLCEQKKREILGLCSTIIECNASSQT